MKKLLLIITIFIVLQACSSKTNYNSSKIIDAKAFNCEKMDVVSGSETVIIKAKDLKECIIKDNKKIVWLYFYYQNCPTQDINVQINQKKIFEKYKDKIEFTESLQALASFITDVIGEDGAIESAEKYLGKTGWEIGKHQ